MLMFKSKEELHKIGTSADTSRNLEIRMNKIEGYNQGVDDAFESFAERVEFYKKYIVSTKNIKINHLIGGMYSIDLWDNFPDLVKQYLKQDEKDYNEWLFDYCFRDM